MRRRPVQSGDYACRGGREEEEIERVLLDSRALAIVLKTDCVERKAILGTGRGRGGGTSFPAAVPTGGEEELPRKVREYYRDQLMAWRGSDANYLEMLQVMSLAHLLSYMSNWVRQLRTADDPVLGEQTESSTTTVSPFFISQYPSLLTYAEMECRVVSRLQAACATRPVVTAYDLEREIAFSEGVEHYHQLGLGTSILSLEMASFLFLGNYNQQGVGGGAGHSSNSSGGGSAFPPYIGKGRLGASPAGVRFKLMPETPEITAFDFLEFLFHSSEARELVQHGGDAAAFVAVFARSRRMHSRQMGIHIGNFRWFLERLKSGTHRSGTFFRELTERQTGNLEGFGQSESYAALMQSIHNGFFLPKNNASNDDDKPRTLQGGFTIEVPPDMRQFIAQNCSGLEQSRRAAALAEPATVGLSHGGGDELEQFLASGQVSVVFGPPSVAAGREGRTVPDQVLAQNSLPITGTDTSCRTGVGLPLNPSARSEVGAPQPAPIARRRRGVAVSDEPQHTQQQFPTPSTALDTASPSVVHVPPGPSLPVVKVPVPSVSSSLETDLERLASVSKTITTLAGQMGGERFAAAVADKKGGNPTKGRKSSDGEEVNAFIENYFTIFDSVARFWERHQESPSPSLCSSLRSRVPVLVLRRVGPQSKVPPVWTAVVLEGGGGDGVFETAPADASLFLLPEPFPSDLSLLPSPSTGAVFLCPQYTARFCSSNATNSDGVNITAQFLRFLGVSFNIPLLPTPIKEEEKKSQGASLRQQRQHQEASCCLRNLLQFSARSKSKRLLHTLLSYLWFRWRSSASESSTSHCLGEEVSNLVSALGESAGGGGVASSSFPWLVSEMGTLVFPSEVRGPASEPSLSATAGIGLLPPRPGTVQGALLACDLPDREDHRYSLAPSCDFPEDWPLDFLNVLGLTGSSASSTTTTASTVDDPTALLHKLRTVVARAGSIVGKEAEIRTLYTALLQRWAETANASTTNGDKNTPNTSLLSSSPQESAANTSWIYLADVDVQCGGGPQLLSTANSGSSSPAGTQAGSGYSIRLPAVFVPPQECCWAIPNALEQALPKGSVALLRPLCNAFHNNFKSFFVKGFGVRSWMDLGVFLRQVARLASAIPRPDPLQLSAIRRMIEVALHHFSGSVDGVPSKQAVAIDKTLPFLPFHYGWRPLVDRIAFDSGAAAREFSSTINPKVEPVWSLSETPSHTFSVFLEKRLGLVPLSEVSSSEVTFEDICSSTSSEMCNSMAQLLLPVISGYLAKEFPLSSPKFRLERRVAAPMVDEYLLRVSHQLNEVLHRTVRTAFEHLKVLCCSSCGHVATLHPSGEAVQHSVKVLYSNSTFYVGKEYAEQWNRSPEHIIREVRNVVQHALVRFQAEAPQQHTFQHQQKEMVAELLEQERYSPMFIADGVQEELRRSLGQNKTGKGEYGFGGETIQIPTDEPTIEKSLRSRQRHHSAVGNNQCSSSDSGESWKPQDLGSHCRYRSQYPPECNAFVASADSLATRRLALRSRNENSAADSSASAALGYPNPMTPSELQVPLGITEEMIDFFVREEQKDEEHDDEPQHPREGRNDGGRRKRPRRDGDDDDDGSTAALVVVNREQQLPPHQPPRRMATVNVLSATDGYDRLAEKYVCQWIADWYRREALREGRDPNAYTAVWTNEHSESGLPYDVVVFQTVAAAPPYHRHQEQQRTAEPAATKVPVEYIEVKSTRQSSQKTPFTLTVREMVLACRLTTGFSVCRVYSADRLSVEPASASGGQPRAVPQSGYGNAVRVERVVDPLTQWRKGRLQLSGDVQVVLL